MYQIIDKKWQDDFGNRSNYRISDVPPGQQDIQVEQAVPSSGKLTLAQAVALATAYNREYQSQKEQLYLSALSLTQARHVFEPQLSGILGGGYSWQDGEESASLNGSLGLTQLLNDGTQITAGIATEWFRYMTGDPRTSLGSVLSAAVTKPLLRGSDKKIVMENLTQAERNTLYQIRSFNHFRKNFVITIISAYYGVLQSLDNVKNAENNYKNLEYTFDRTRYQADAGRIARFEQDQVEQDVLRARDGLLQAQQSYQQSLDEFKIVLCLPTDAALELDPDELQSLEGKGMENPEFTVEEAVVAALDLRLDLANSREQVDDAARQVDVAIDSLRAEMNLLAGANVDSKPHTRFADLQFQDGVYNLGFELDLPLDRLAERNAYRQSLIAWTQQNRAYELECDQVTLGVRKAYRDLLKEADSYRIQLKSLSLAEMRFESTSMLQQAGRVTTRDVLDSQKDLLDAQNAATNALVRHTIAKLVLFRDVGVLEVRPDGLWEQKPWKN